MPIGIVENSTILLPPLVGHSDCLARGPDHVNEWPTPKPQIILGQEARWSDSCHFASGVAKGPSPEEAAVTDEYQKDPAAIAQLNDRQFAVTQEAATEPAFHNEFWDKKDAGIYVDIVSGEPLFASVKKFDSGCGWPSFTIPLEPANVVEKTDTSHGMVRTEVHSKHGDSHLGHVFDDGPTEEGGLRYCINSAALRFVPYADLEAEGYGQYESVFDQFTTGRQEA